jgi:threonine dehydrogenase-like Zn-dependent dehydrogenase
MFGVELDGSFAEYMLVPSPDRVLIETKMDGKIAALIGDTFATGLHAVEQAGLSEGEAVAIIGAGPVGCTTLISALRRKPSNVYVIARSKYRLEIAKKLGGIVVDATEARKRILDETLLGVDAVIDCAGSQATIDLAMKLLKKGGRAVITSVMSQAELSMLDVMMGEKRLIGSYCPPGPKYLAKTLEFVQTNNLLSDLSCLITHEFDLRKGLDAISSFNSPDRMKILINP